MQERRTDLESRVDELSRRLEAVEGRLAALEASPGRAAGAGAVLGETEQAGATEVLEPAGGSWFSAEALPRYGRTLVVLGGAFLLRALTEGGVVPQVAGTGLGIVYAIVWIVMVDRAAAAGRLRSATFHGLAATAIAFPLLWEATVQFQFLPPVASAGALAIITALALVVVARRRLGGLAWVITLGSATTALALAFSTKMWSLFVFELLLLALVTIRMGYVRGWRGLAWTTSALVTGTVLLMTAMLLLASAERIRELFRPDMLLALQLSWVVGFFGTVGYRKLGTTEDLTAGEIVLGLATLAAGFGGATLVTHSSPVSPLSLAAVSVVLAAGFYGMAFAFADRRLGRRLSFICYSTFALLVTLIASSALLRGNGLAVLLSAAALVTGWLGTRRERATLNLHSAVYILAAGLAAGLFVNGIEALGAALVPSPAWITPYVGIVVVVAGVLLWFPVAAHGRTWGRFSAAPMLVVIAVVAFGIGSVAVTLCGRLVPATAAGPPDPGILAAMRTGVLAASAVVLAWLSRSPRWPEAFWLLYPALALGGVKLLVDDVRRGRPATLFFSFVLYGAALILAPRLARRQRR